MLPVLVDTASFTPATYNPRKADPRRLTLVGVSLRKLGFVLPLYLDQSGEGLSGHQRHLVAQRMGVRQVPAVYLSRALELNERQALNLAFNRATNDMDSGTTARDLSEEMARLNIEALADALPDKVPDTPAFYPCLTPVTIPLQPLVDAHAGQWVAYARNMAARLARKGVLMPLVVTEGGRLLNGIGRLQYLAERGATEAEAVILSEAEGDLAWAMLNLLSMDFDLETRYADTLRHNSFRRAQTGGPGELGYGWTLFAFPRKPASYMKLGDVSHRLAFERTHGTRFLDFGAGRQKEAAALRAAGYEVTVFEPYVCPPGTNDIDPAASRDLTRAFLAEVASGRTWTSLFLTAVLNSVPFEGDRLHVVRLLSALAWGGEGAVFASANSILSPNWANAVASAGAHSLSKGYDRDLRWRADYEGGTTLSGDNRHPKAQKFHSKREFYDLFKSGFEQVQVGYYNRVVVWAVAARPLSPDRDALRESIAFEFDLPYPDGTRMNLVGEALAAFGARLGIEW